MNCHTLEGKAYRWFNFRRLSRELPMHSEDLPLADLQSLLSSRLCGAETTTVRYRILIVFRQAPWGAVGIVTLSQSKRCALVPCKIAS